MGEVTQEESDRVYENIISVMSGDADELYRKTKEEMEEASQKLEFEKAAELRDVLRSVSVITEKQRPMVSQK